MPFLDAPQHSDEWWNARLGRATASRMADVMSFLTRKSKSGVAGDSSSKRNAYMMELVTERLTGCVTEHYVTPAMQHGIDTERHAVAAYEVVSENTTEKCGIAIHENIDGMAASPDRTVAEDGLLEAKCPTTAVHLSCLLSGNIPEIYIPQMVCQLACTGRKWVDFCSFDPRLPYRNQVFIRRMERDEKQIAELEYAAVEFLAEVNAKIQLLGGENPLKEQLRRSVEREDEELARDVDWIKAKHATT